MDIAMYEGELLNITSELSRYEESEKEREIDKFKKAAEKMAMTCPYCYEQLLLRAGEIRDIHFSHLSGKTCQESRAYDTYNRQTARESQKHTVIKEIIYNELKGQELIRPDLKVEYGYKEKATEKWSQYPDIYVNKNGREFAVSIITNVHQIGDQKVVKAINSRNKYFAGKGLETIWFVEDRELADDYERRVLHLWEAEYGLAIKTEEDHKWDKLLQELYDEFPEYNLYTLFGYKAHGTMKSDVRSLYYVHTVGDEITFSVYRLILDQMRSPFRAFALTKGYRMNISQALVVRDEILLSDKDQEDRNRTEFANQVLLQINTIQREASLRDQHTDADNEQMENGYNYSELTRQKIKEAAATTAYSPDFDVVASIANLKILTIAAYEVESLYWFLKRHKDELGDYGLTWLEVKKWVLYALGRVNDPKIRKWLVDIEDIR